MTNEIALVLAFLYVYNSKSSRTTTLEYGIKSLRKLGWGGNEDADETASKFSQEDVDDTIMVKSFPLSIFYHVSLNHFIVLFDIYEV